MPGYPTDWDFYITSRGDGLASVMVNLALQEVVPVESLPECVTIQVPLRSPNEHGLSTPEERPQMNAIEDALRDALAAERKLLFVGRRIVNGRFDLVFFSTEGSDVEGVVDRVMADFPGYDAESLVASDPDWDVFLRDLFPNPVELRQILNQRILRQLEAEGDDHSHQRPVRHWIGFENALARAEFVAAIDGRQFDVEDSEPDGDESPFRLRLERTDAVDHNSINEITIDLMLLAEQYDGKYGGWETDVVR